MSKKCSYCTKTKPDPSFYKRSDKPHLLQSHCIECIKKKRRDYRFENIEKFKAKDKKYHKKNRPKRLEYLREYQKNHLCARAGYQRNKRKTDPQFKLQERLRGRINHAIKREYKKSSAFDLLGCSLGFFEIYFESLFSDGMNWGKFLSAEIHIDHIRPCSSFDLTKKENQKKCFHYTNLQPLWAKDNLLKGRQFKEVINR